MREYNDYLFIWDFVGQLTKLKLEHYLNLLII